MEEKVKVVTLRNELTGDEDRYALGLMPIGEGKYAKVYRAVNIRNPSRVFAVKVIKMESEEVRRQYLKELRIIQNLPPCPYLVRTHKQYLDSGNHLYIFQEYCEGGTLMNIRTEKLGSAMSEEEIYDLFYQLSSGLIALLEAGIVHEDIKPVNILKRGRLFKLCDFGVSEIEAECKESTTRKGTISYMPPEKLKSRRFLPNDKSDIFSLGTCLYEIIFGFHPYLKKKTPNYKEYLIALEEANLRPTSVLMKKIGSSSLRLENLLKFLERMIDLNQKTRVSLAQLKDFIRTTEPFKFMSPAEQPEDAPSQPDRDSYAQNFKLLQESVIHYTKTTEDTMAVTSAPKLPPQSPTEQFSTLNQQMLTRDRLREEFREENLFFVDVLGLLLRGVDYIRRSNFCDLNLMAVGKNVGRVDLSDCKLSRYLKYLAFEFALAVQKRQEMRYGEYLAEDVVEGLKEDRSFLNNEYNKFLIESSFARKAEFAEALSQLDPVQLWREISRVLEQSLQGLCIVKENKKEYLLSILYCCHMPKLLHALTSIRTVFDNHPIDQPLLSQSYLADTTIETARNILIELAELEKEKTEKVRGAVERELQRREVEVLFEIEESSGDIEIIEQNDLE